MTTIKLTHEIVKETIFYSESDFDFEGEHYEFIMEIYSSIDDDGRDFTYLYRRKSDGKNFKITVYQVRYGYESYDYEDFANECELIEVEKREKVVTTWEVV